MARNPKGCQERRGKRAHRDVVTIGNFRARTIQTVELSADLGENEDREERVKHEERTFANRQSPRKDVQRNGKRVRNLPFSDQNDLPSSMI